MNDDNTVAAFVFMLEAFSPYMGHFTPFHTKRRQGASCHKSGGTFHAFGRQRASCHNMSGNFETSRRQCAPIRTVCVKFYTTLTLVCLTSESGEFEGIPLCCNDVITSVGPLQYNLFLQDLIAT